MPSININVRPSTGQIFQVNVDSESTTVQGLKQLIGEKMGNIDASSLKLVFSGRILKNEDLVNDCSKVFYDIKKHEPWILNRIINRNYCWKYSSCCSFWW